MTKIVHLIPCLAYSGGIENYIRNLCSVPPTENLQIILVTFFNNNENKIVQELISNGYNIKVLRKTYLEKLSNRYLKFLLKNSGFAHERKLNDLRKLLKNINPDIIYAHGEDSELISGFLCEEYKIINVIHGENYFPLNPFFRFVLYNISRNNYHATIFVNEKLAGEFKKRSEKIYTVKPGINIEESRPRDWKERSPGFIIGFLGRLAKEKGIYTLINAFDLFQQKHPKTRLLIGGKGKEFKKIQKFINNLGISDNVELKGEITNTNEFYQQLDFLILPSESEGLPITILEALASGVPVIASNVGGVSEVVIDDFNGRLINGNNPGDYASAILDLINTPEKLDRFKSNCVNSVSDYNIRNFVNKFYSTLELID